MSDLSTEDQARYTEEAKAQYEKSLQYIGEEEIAAAAQSGEEKVRKLEKALPKALEAVWSDVKLLVSMIRDYVSGAYGEVPFGTIAAVAAAILYLVSPFDAIPDFIPVIGYIDDAAVIALCLRMVHNDIEQYRVWKGKKVLDE